MEKKGQRGRGWSTSAVAGLALAVALALLLPAGLGLAQEKPAKTLYERMGGYDAISGIVEDLLNQLHDDPAFKRFGGGRADDSQARTKQLIKDQFCWLADGPCVYTGRDMKTAHAGLEVTTQEWESMAQKLQASLEKFKVAEPERKEFMAKIEEFRKDIVAPPKEEKPQTQN